MGILAAEFSQFLLSSCAVDKESAYKTVNEFKELRQIRGTVM